MSSRCGHKCMRTVLVIAHEYPPIGGASVMRIAKLTRYLPEHGWRVVVVTADPADSGYDHAGLQDDALFGSVRDKVDIVRGSSPIERYVRQLGRRYVGDPFGLAMGNVGAVAGQGNSPVQSLKKLAHLVYVFQDESGLWTPFAVRDALTVIRRQRIDAILTTSPPHLTHMAGYLVKRVTGLPWVADFRDGWTDNFVFRSRSRKRRLLDFMMERVVATTADVKLAVTNSMLRSFQSSYPALAHTFRLLPNGFDPADFTTIHANHAGDRVLFLHMGSIGGPRNPAHFLAAFAGLFERKVLRQDDVSIEFYGSVNAIQLDQLPQIGALFHERVPHYQATQRMREAGVLVLLAGLQYGEGAFASKVYEYIATQRPILAIVPIQSEVAGLLRDYPLCVLASPDDREQIMRAITQTYELARGSTIKQNVDPDWVNQFSRRQQAGMLAEMLNELCEAQS